MGQFFTISFSFLTFEILTLLSSEGNLHPEKSVKKLRTQCLQTHRQCSHRAKINKLKIRRKKSLVGWCKLASFILSALVCALKTFTSGTQSSREFLEIPPWSITSTLSMIPWARLHHSLAKHKPFSTLCFDYLRFTSPPVFPILLMTDHHSLTSSEETTVITS